MRTELRRHFPSLAYIRPSLAGPLEGYLPNPFLQEWEVSATQELARIGTLVYIIGFLGAVQCRNGDVGGTELSSFLSTIFRRGGCEFLSRTG